MNDAKLSAQDRHTAAVLTLAHVIRQATAETEGGVEYAHDYVAEEYETWLGYTVGVGEPVSPIDDEWPTCPECRGLLNFSSRCGFCGWWARDYTQEELREKYPDWEWLER